GGLLLSPLPVGGGISGSRGWGGTCDGPPGPEVPRGGAVRRWCFGAPHIGPACRELGLRLPVIYVVTDWDRAYANRRACRYGASGQVEADAPRNREDGGRAASRRRRGCRNVWAAGRRQTVVVVDPGAHVGCRRRVDGALCIRGVDPRTARLAGRNGPAA